MSSVLVSKRDHSETDEWQWIVEDLDKQLGFYDDDLNLFGRLESEIFSAGRDTPASSKWKMYLDATEMVPDFESASLQLGLEYLGLHSQVPTRDAVILYKICIQGVSRRDVGPVFSVKRKTTVRVGGRRNTIIMSLPAIRSNFVQLFPDNKLRIVVNMTLLFKRTQSFAPANQDDDVGGGDSIFSKMKKPKVDTTFENLYGEMILKQKLFDVTILCEDKTFPAHKSILSTRSPVFCKMLDSPMRESEKNEIKIGDLDVATLQLMLKFMYTGKIDEIELPTEHDPLLALLDCAERFDLEKLKLDCLDKICSPITDRNAGDMALTAYRYNADPDRIAGIRKYCLERHGILMKDPKYRKVYCQHPEAFVGEC